MTTGFVIWCSSVPIGTWKKIATIGSRMNAKVSAIAAK